MIIGTGLMARAFSEFGERNDLVVFASGVSNSMERESAAFHREHVLLEKTIVSNPGKLMIYFGTCSIFDPDRTNSEYARHKLRMEALIEERCKQWLVLRLGLAIGPLRGGTTLHEVLLSKITRGEHFEVWTEAVRYPIDVDDVFRIVQLLVSEKWFWNRSVNIALRAFPILEFVSVIAGIVRKEAVFDCVARGHPYKIKTPELDEINNKLTLDRSSLYLDRVFRKYLVSTPIAAR